MESLSTVFRRALLNLSKASNLPTIQDETQVVHDYSLEKQSFVELAGQELIDIALKDCRDSRARVADLALFSPNETLDDISTQDLVYLSVPYVSAEIESRARAIERDERLARLREAEVRLLCPLSGAAYLRGYISTLWAAGVHQICVRLRSVRNRVQIRAGATREERPHDRRSRPTTRDQDQAVPSRKRYSRPH
jgi:TAP42-like family